jgi:hypothetical protein
VFCAEALGGIVALEASHTSDLLRLLRGPRARPAASERRGGDGIHQRGGKGRGQGEHDRPSGRRHLMRAQARRLRTPDHSEAGRRRSARHQACDRRPSIALSFLCFGMAKMAFHYGEAPSRILAQVAFDPDRRP